MATPDRAAIPKLSLPATAEGFQRLPLDGTDGFVISRIDGKRSVSEIIHATGLSADVVLTSLSKLAGLGVVSGLPIAAPPAAPPSPPRAPEPGPKLASADGIDLDEAHRERIVETHAKLSHLDFYQLLGVPRDADKKAIKRAYFELAGLFHPDRFFRKELGPYKAKMEAVFARVTEAHDALTNKNKRGEYDAYLKEQGGAFEPPQPAPKPIPKPIPTVASPPSSGPMRAAAPSVPPPEAMPADPRARREALARRLLGGRSLSPTSVPAQPAPAAPPHDALKQHYESRRGAERNQARTLADEARAAAQRGDATLAMQKYQLALSLLPGDPEMVQALAQETQKAQALAAENHRKQAVDEEQRGLHADAARSWGIVARLCKDDADAHDRAARNLVKAGGDLHQASTFAQQAVMMTPLNATYRATLGLVYLEAGLVKNARRELDAAEQLDPLDASIAALIKRLGPRIG